MPCPTSYITFEDINMDLCDPDSSVFASCTFIRCDFTSVNVIGFHFIDCTFIECNLEGTKWKNCTLKNCHFSKCEMQKLDFAACAKSVMAADFNSCFMEEISFSGIKGIQLIFKNCNLSFANFIRATLKEASFRGCDLRDAHFEETNLEKADFRRAKNVMINPLNNKIKEAKFSEYSLSGLVGAWKLDIE